MVLLRTTIRFVVACTLLAGLPAFADDLSDIAARIVGGATLLQDVASGREVDDLHERAHHIERMLEEDRGRAHVGEDWEELRAAFDRVKRSRSGRSRDDRVRFLVEHLENDIEAGARIAGRAGPGRPSGEAGRLTLIDRETCVGDARVGPRPCPSPRDAVTFRLPRDVDVIRRISAEWRDFGRGSKARVYLNDRLVWETDVARDWDPDGRALNLRVPRGSTITVTSRGGEAIWIRRLELEAGREETGQRYQWPWESW